MCPTFASGITCKKPLTIPNPARSTGTITTSCANLNPFVFSRGVSTSISIRERFSLKFTAIIFDTLEIAALKDSQSV